MFDSNLTKRFLTHIDSKSLDELEEINRNAPSSGMEQILEEYPLRSNLMRNLSNSSVHFDNYLDKKEKHLRKDYGKGCRISFNFFKKHVGKTFEQLIQLINFKQYKHFQKMGYLDKLLMIKQNTHSSFIFNTQGLLELREELKIVTTKDNQNPFLFKKIEVEPLDQNDSIDNKISTLISYLEKEGYTIDSSEGQVHFYDKGVKGFAFNNPVYTYYHGRIFVENAEYFNKVSRCSLVTDLPKSSLGFKSLMKELKHLGSKLGKKEVGNDSYKPKHVNLVQWY